MNNISHTINYDFRTLNEFLLEIPINLDAPVSICSTDIYNGLSELYDEIYFEIHGTYESDVLMPTL